jgi:uncharacterized protein (DUF952 family)
LPDILHIVHRQMWERAVAEGEYRGETLATEGFLHASTQEQLSMVANTFYKGQTGLVLLRIDPARVLAPIRWESPPGSEEKFPHIHGPLNLDAVVEVTSLEPGDAGNFDL